MEIKKSKKDAIMGKKRLNPLDSKKGDPFALCIYVASDLRCWTA